MELVKIRTILELTGGRFSKEPAKIVSIVLSSIFAFAFLEFVCNDLRPFFWRYGVHLLKTTCQKLQGSVDISLVTERIVDALKICMIRCNTGCL